MNAIWVAEQGPAILVKPPKEPLGGGSLWDYAATACIFSELGLAATDFLGHPLDLNRTKDTFMNERGIVYSNL